ncbi:MAG: cobalamin B12-binding domain-containing protein [Verrucomicrobia bacterium]|nr:cobalamin B12-binding domain-containing protein [Verrucomicrobiota bacterium]
MFGHRKLHKQRLVSDDDTLSRHACARILGKNAPLDPSADIGYHEPVVKKLDALIINPGALESIYQELSRTIAAVEPPIWTALLANHLRHKGYSVAIMDCEGEWLSAPEAAARIAAYDPRLIVVAVYGQQPSASTQNMHGAGLLCKAIKQLDPDRKILLVGGHVAALPEQTLREEAADFVCQGEGPATIRGLLESDMETPEHLARVPGLWHRKDGQPVFSSPARLIGSEELSAELPGMAWDILPMKNYRAHNWHCFGHISQRQPYASLYTSLGCPFHCSFCCINAPFGGSGFRHWDPAFTITQFDLLAEQYGVRNVKIADEMFVLKERHFLELCRLLKDHNHGFNIWAYSRIDTVKPGHLRALKDAGVNWLVLGIESHSKYVRDGVTKGRFTGEDIARVVRQIQEAGIQVMGNYIFGLPDDDFDSMQVTLDMAIDLKTEWANFYSAMAYPGSQLYQFAVANQWRLPETWLGYSQHARETLPLPTKHVSAGEVLAFRDRAWEIYFTNPGYLSCVKAKFGEETLQHVVEMTRYKLKRKFAAPLPDAVPQRRAFAAP